MLHIFIAGRGAGALELDTGWSRVASQSANEHVDLLAAHPAQHILHFLHRQVARVSLVDLHKSIPGENLGAEGGGAARARVDDEEFAVDQLHAHAQLSILHSLLFIRASKGGGCLFHRAAGSWNAGGGGGHWAAKNV